MGREIQKSPSVYWRVNPYGRRGTFSWQCQVLRASVLPALFKDISEANGHTAQLASAATQALSTMTRQSAHSRMWQNAFAPALQECQKVLHQVGDDRVESSDALLRLRLLRLELAAAQRKSVAGALAEVDSNERRRELVDPKKVVDEGFEALKALCTEHPDAFDDLARVVHKYFERRGSRPAV